MVVLGNGLGWRPARGAPPDSEAVLILASTPPDLLLAVNPQREAMVERPGRGAIEPAKAELPRRGDDEPAALPVDPMSPAEKLARLRRSLENDQRRHTELLATIQDSGGNFARTEEEFRRLDQEVERLKKQLARETAAAATDDARQTETQLKPLLDSREKVKQRFDAAIAERRAAQEAIKNLEQKIRVDKEAVDKLLGQSPPAATPSELAPLVRPGASVAPPALGTAPLVAPASASSNPPPAPPPPTTVADLLQSVTGAALAPQVPTPTAPGVMPQLNPLPTSAPGASSAVPVVAQPTGVAPLVSNSPPTAKDKILREAAAVAEKSVAAAREAEEEAKSLTDRIELLRRNIEAERRLRDAAQQRVDDADDAVQRLSDAMHSAIADGRDPSSTVDQLQETEDRRREARREWRHTSTRLDALQTEYARLRDEQIKAFEEAERKRDAADAALRRVATLNNPFSPGNVLQWLIDHGPRVLSILLAMTVTLWFSRLAGRRFISFMVGRGMRGSAGELENRAHTLVGVLHNAINVGTVAAGIVTILDEIGVPVGPVMGGAAVFGLAVAFGAQSLIKDYFTGFMLLMEQQYLVNDVVRIGEVSGQVERFSLRMTVLRDVDGNAHFIPHGQITSVTNLSHTWSRAVVDLTVGFDEDVDRVIAELQRLTDEFQQDPEFGPLVLEEPMILGVDRLADSGVVVRFWVKTPPLQQWPVKRELLRRVKKRFDELGIDFPYPQRTVHIRQPATESPTLQIHRDAA